MWKRGDVPGVTSHGAGEEAVGVVYQVTDDNFNNFLRKPGCGGIRSSRGLLWSISGEGFLDPGFDSIPNFHSEQQNKQIIEWTKRSVVDS